MISRNRAARAATFLLLLVPLTVGAQIGAIRKAAETARDRLPSVESLFGNGPVITTGLEDARDGVALLDDFTPRSYSPLMEMPRAQDGMLLLVPGAYVGMLQSFCLQPGTHGPQRGEGYLHAEWEGPRSNIVSTIITRYGEQNEVTQSSTQKLLWAIIARADLRKADRDVQLTAARLLTPAEILDLTGYSLNAVPAALARRVLQSTPDATRRLLVAENQLREMFSSAETSYAEYEQVAVNTGALPESEARYAIPWKRWSYHPAGYFIRYTARPREYYLMRVEIYYPEKVEIRRDASGRIISIASADGRRFEPPNHAASVQLASLGGLSTRDVLVGAIGRGPGDARRTLMQLAMTDYSDLATIRRSLSTTQASDRAGTRDLLQEAMHAALARYIGLMRLETLDRGSALEMSLRPKATLNGFSYVIEPVVVRKPGMMLPGGMGPSGGGGVAPGQRQRLGPSLGMQGPPPHLWGGPSGEQPDDALDRAEKAMDAMNKANAAKDFFSGGALDKAAMGAGTAADKAPGGFGPATSPSGMFAAGWAAAAAAARSISNAMGGGDAFLFPGMGRGRDVAMSPPSRTMIFPASHSSMRAIGMAARSPARLDYRTISKPRIVTFNPFTYPANRAHADATNAMLRSTLRLATLLEAWMLAEQRMADAANARDEEWQLKQGKALIHLKHETGVTMVQLSEDIATARRTSPPGPLTTAEGVAAAQADLRRSGYHPDVVSVSQQLGMTGSELEAQRQSVLAQNPQTVAARFPSVLQELQDALLAYGKYLMKVPEVSPPWN